MLETSSEKPVNLFWTGGWESTFRLMQLTLHEKRVVQPYYIVYTGRISLPNELRTMKLIREQLLQFDPVTQKLILPTRYTLLENIKEDPEITAAYQLILQKNRLGFQYAWLAWFCKEHNITDMELCMERSIHPENSLSFESYLEDIGSAIFAVPPHHTGTPEYTIFRYFTFPVYAYTKPEIGGLARKFGWWNIQKRTWFCYTPIHGRIPCGTCHPCKLSISENRGRGVPLYIRVLNKFGLTNLLRKVMHQALLLTHKNAQSTSNSWEDIIVEHVTRQ